MQNSQVFISNYMDERGTAPTGSPAPSPAQTRHHRQSFDQSPPGTEPPLHAKSQPDIWSPMFHRGSWSTASPQPLRGSSFGAYGALGSFNTGNGANGTNSVQRPGPSPSFDSERYRSGGMAWGSAELPRRRLASFPSAEPGVVTGPSPSSTPEHEPFLASLKPANHHYQTKLGHQPVNLDFTGPAISVLDRFSNLGDATKQAELAARNATTAASHTPQASPHPATPQLWLPPQSSPQASHAIPVPIPAPLTSRGSPSMTKAVPTLTKTPMRPAFSPGNSPLNQSANLTLGSLSLGPGFRNTPPFVPSNANASASASTASASGANGASVNGASASSAVNGAGATANGANINGANANANGVSSANGVSGTGVSNGANSASGANDSKSHRGRRKRVDSPFLERLRTAPPGTFQLEDILGNVVEASTDQLGSRFIQDRLGKASDQLKHQFLVEALPRALALSTDVFGNYVVQLLFEVSSPEDRKQLWNVVRGNVLDLTLQMYGCRVVQMAIKYLDPASRLEVVNELRTHILRCIRDHNGNHVVQKALEHVPASDVQFIYDDMLSQALSFAKHMYGCRVVQRALEHGSPEAQARLLQTIKLNIGTLVLDQYGNYVVQHVVEHGAPQDREFVLNKLISEVVKLSGHKYASNVIEKCYIKSTATQRSKMVSVIVDSTIDGEPAVLSMMKDQYANYVIQRILGTARDDDYDRLARVVKKNLPIVKRSHHGKHLQAIERRLR